MQRRNKNHFSSCHVLTHVWEEPDHGISLFAPAQPLLRGRSLSIYGRGTGMVRPLAVKRPLFSNRENLEITSALMHNKLVGSNSLGVHVSIRLKFYSTAPLHGTFWPGACLPQVPPADEASFSTHCRPQSLRCASYHLPTSPASGPISQVSWSTKLGAHLKKIKQEAGSFEAASPTLQAGVFVN